MLTHRLQGRQVEARVLEFVFPTDTNHLGTIFGGTLVAWMDKAAAFAAIRRAHSTVVTASIDSIDFKVPIRQGDIAELVALVERVGRTSLRVRVEVNREDPMDGSRELCTVGYFTMVAVGEDGRPKPVPPENAAG
ncbi:MAG: acyl-CoA thioesterase [Actinomycetota bacterium]|jgi:acyl-CoA hydrolase|nr:acyl-CoA thioesterase [Actinomycetota bacterium]